MFKKILLPTLCLLSYGLYANPQTITIENAQNHFTANPHFDLNSDPQCKAVWWQISSSEEFFPETILSEGICHNIDSIVLSQNEKEILDDHSTYYFHARGCGENECGSWSDPFFFTIEKESDVQKPTCTYASKRVSSDNETEYVRNPYVSEEIWNALSPYFLPATSPEKAALDRIFSQKRRILSSRKAMIRSGFSMISRPKDKVIVAKHPYLKGYLIKAYTDNMQAPDTYWWKKRIDGVNIIQQKINQYGYQGIMKTPRKWIYPIPTEPSPMEGATNRKNFILVVEEMDILDAKHNLKAYKTKMTPQILDAFFIILMELGLIDSVYADNTPFCTDGRLAFIDTEHSLETTRPVPISVVAKYLSPQMYTYWEQLIVNGIPNR